MEEKSEKIMHKLTVYLQNGQLCEYTSDEWHWSFDFPDYLLIMHKKEIIVIRIPKTNIERAIEKVVQ